MKVFFIGTSQVHRVEKIMQNKISTSIESLKENRILRIIENIKRIKESDIIYGTFIGLFNKRNIIYLSISKILKKKVICHWIGSDVLEALKHPKKTVFIQRFIDVNLSGSSLLKKELKTIGIDSEEEHIVLSDISYEVEDMPIEHAILTYLPTNSVKFYGGENIKRLASEFPNIKFYVVANENKNEFKDQKNIINLGKISLKEMEKIYKKISILIRQVEHDGLSLMLLEALAKGKEVIYSYEFPFTYESKDYESLKIILNKIIKEKPIKNLKGSNFIKENFTTEKYINNLLRRFYRM